MTRHDDNPTVPPEAMRDAAPAGAIGPITPRERITSVDVLRGFALFGILLLNITAFGLPNAAFSDPTVAGGAAGVNFAWWFVSQVLFEGKMRTIFSMLFGAGVVLLTTRAENQGGGARIADIYYRRTMWLILFGLLHAYLIWSGDILYGYGVAGLFLFPFRRQSAKFLLTAGLIVLALGVPKSVLEGRRLESLRVRARQADAAAAGGRALTEKQIEAQSEWHDTLKGMKPTTAQVREEVEAHRGSYVTLFLRRMDEVSEGESTGFYRFGFIDVAGMMLLGMGLLKLGVFSAARSSRFYAGLALCGYGAGVPINWYITRRDAAYEFEPAQMFFGWTGYDLGRLAVALGHIAVVVLLFKSGVMPGLARRLAAVGRMALSNYLATSIICTTLFEGYGFGLFARLQRAELLLVVLPIWMAQLLWSPLWLRRFRFGPMEWVWRSLVYWRPQPMRLAAARSPEPLPAAAAPRVPSSDR
jgi:uncharacterized protein